jgi:hypothetical protein
MKVSAVKRRVKRRSERKSRHNKKANLVRSRKQRGRNTARKVMRGGENEIIKITTSDKDNNNLQNAVTLKFSDTNKLLMSVDLNIFKGDVRNLLNELFTIVEFGRETTHSKNKFLMGLADHPARSKTIDKAKEYAGYKSKDHKTCMDPDKALKEIEKKTEHILSITTCDLEIELSEQDKNIVFTVKKYHRMKFGTTTCKNIDSVREYDGRNWRYRTINVDIELFYPYLEFASSKPFFGGEIDYIDYEVEISKIFINIFNILKKGQKDNLFTFTVPGTIEELKQNLKKKSIMVDTEGELTTSENEARKLIEATERAEAEAAAAAAAAERKRLYDEKERIKNERYEEYKRRQAEQLRLKYEEEQKRRASLTPEERDQEDRDNEARAKWEASR